MFKVFFIEDCTKQLENDFKNLFAHKSNNNLVKLYINGFAKYLAQLKDTDTITVKEKIIIEAKKLFDKTNLKSETIKTSNLALFIKQILSNPFKDKYSIIFENEDSFEFIKKEFKLPESEFNFFTRGCLVKFNFYKLELKFICKDLLDKSNKLSSVVNELISVIIKYRQNNNEEHENSLIKKLPQIIKEYFRHTLENTCKLREVVEFTKKIILTYIDSTDEIPKENYIDLQYTILEIIQDYLWQCDKKHKPQLYNILAQNYFLSLQGYLVQNATLLNFFRKNFNIKTEHSKDLEGNNIDGDLLYASLKFCRDEKIKLEIGNILQVYFQNNKGALIEFEFIDKTPFIKKIIPDLNKVKATTKHYPFEASKLFYSNWQKYKDEDLEKANTAFEFIQSMKSLVGEKSISDQYSKTLKVSNLLKNNLTSSYVDGDLFSFIITLMVKDHTITGDIIDWVEKTILNYMKTTSICMRFQNAENFKNIQNFTTSLEVTEIIKSQKFAVERLKNSIITETLKSEELTYKNSESECIFILDYLTVDVEESVSLTGNFN